MDDRDVADFATVGAFVLAGSRFEDDSTVGAAHLLSNLAFKPHSGCPDMPERVSGLGGNFYAMAMREALIFQGTVLHANVDAAIKLLAETVTRYSFHTTEIQAAYDTTCFNISEGLKQPAVYARDYLVQLAYPLQSIGRNLYTDDRSRILKTSNALNAYACKRNVASNIVFALAGIKNHEYASELVAKHTAFVKHGHTDDPPVEYRGGFKRFVIKRPPAAHPNDVDVQSYLQLAYQAPGAKDYQAGLHAQVLRFLLGGGDSFSAGGPGKGMYSRLYTQVLNRYRGAESCIAFYDPFSSSGLFGIAATCTATLNKHMLNIVYDQLAQIASGKADRREVERAKNQLRSYLFTSLESQGVRTENAGLQTLLRNAYVLPRQVDEFISSISASDIKSFTAQMLATRPTCVILGENLDGFPEFN